ncbi:MAG: hypothetical protein KDE46_12450 [Caldilineaceae bacterium]|nr:hypothetical protein [Caldilineaceae bacterium]
MTKITIFPISTEQGETSYFATSGDKQSIGATAGEALDALTPQLEVEQSNTLVLLQNLRPDAYFTSEQMKKLSTLMQQWRKARDESQLVSQKVQSELEEMIEAELLASAARAAALANELGQ